MKRILSDTKRQEKIRNLRNDYRDRNGRFLKGRPNTYKKSFSKDYNVHKPQLYWDRKWLVKEYIENNRSVKNISEEFLVAKGTIKHWLRKYNIYKTNDHNNRSK